MCFVLLFFLALGSKSIDPIEQVKSMMEDKKYRQAYDTAVMYLNKQGLLDADPNMIFLRGQCAYQIAKYDESIKDLSRFLTSGASNDDDKQKAYKVRGQARMRLGLLDDAKNDAKLSKDTNLQSQISNLEKLVETAEKQKQSEKWEDAISTYKSIVKTAISAVKFFVEACQCALKMNDKDNFLELSNLAMQISSKDPKLLEMRGKFFMCDGDLDLASKHFKACMSVASDSSSCTILLKASTNFQDLRKKIINSTNKKDYETAKPLVNKCEDISKRRCPANSKLSSIVSTLQVKLLVSEGKTSTALSFLDDLLKDDPNNTELLLERADLYLKEGDYDNSMKDYQTVHKISQHNDRANKGIEKVSKIQEKEKNINFYDVLELPHGASISEVKDAYKAQVKKWHPDRYSDPAKKREAEKRMKNINRAYDVLTDENKKRMYDMGQDPENPGFGGFNGGGGGGNGMPHDFPFQFFHFGGGGGGAQHIRFNFG